ncbi:dephospho-CoA kinase [Aliagarivorans marinus]|uniref:dephospho-CoA kinase n=1 Tax=Aliagarivorans marinus TaxID=561965 RepID=UPI00041DB710|nr:dephospho-CoA kinase [Aliagarivorans marinus]
MIVGLTGGIASGKTAVSDYLAEQGVPVVDADVVARQVVEPGQSALASIAQHFGHELLQADGSLDRAALRQRIFNNHQEKQWLEALLHPLIRKTIRKQLDDAQGPYKLLVAPLLLENGLESMVDRVLVIDAPVDAQLNRGAARDNNSREQIEQIVAAQLPREQRVAKADDVICNDQDLEHLQKQALALHQRYLELAKAHDRI